MQTSIIHQNIIKIDYYKPINAISKNMIHEPHEYARCISNAKKHHQPLI